MRKQIKKTETQQRGKYRCPFCGKNKMRRSVVGIWFCRSCGKTVAGGAYTLTYVELTILLLLLLLLLLLSLLYYHCYCYFFLLLLCAVCAGAIVQG